MRANPFVRHAAIAIAAAIFFLESSAGASAIVYAGAPNLALTARLVAAGEDRGVFRSERLFIGAYGAAWPMERASLRARFGAQRLRDCFAVFDYAIADALRIVARDKVAVPAPVAASEPLAAELFDAGMTPAGRYDVGYMLERLVTHAYHHEIMVDLDARFNPRTNAAFHLVLTSLVQDAHRNRETRV